MTVLFIVFMDFVIKCIGGYCQNYSAEAFNTLLKSGALELVFDASLALKIFMQKSREENSK